MRARKIIFVGVLMLAAVAVARGLGLWVSGQFTSPTAPASPPPALVFESADLTFGPIPESELIERDLHLTNTTAEPITVERFDTSCSCLGVEPAGPLTLVGGESKTLRIKLKAAIPGHAKLSADDLFEESVTVSAVVSKAISPTGRVPAEFRYTVRQTIRFEPAVVSLGVVSHREPVVAKTTLTIRPPIKDVRVLPHPHWNVSETAKGDGVREITATPAKPGEPRVLNDLLQVVPVGTDGEDRPVRFLTVRGEVKQDVVSTPADLPLGRVKVGTTFEESFRLVSLTGRTFEVIQATSATADAAITRDTTDPMQFNVRVQSTATGDQERWVTVTAKQDDGTTCVVKVPIRYFGE
jgi:hypothetical protein